MSAIRSFDTRVFADPTARVSAPREDKRLLLDERFTTKNTTDWGWGAIKGDAGFSVGPHLELFANAGASKKAYADAEVHTTRAYYRKNLDMVVSGPALANGSRGWGYWNHSFDPKTAEIAGFIALQGGPDYKYNGFYIYHQHGASGPKLIKLDERLLESAHTYSVQWLGNAIAYKIDGREVHRVTGDIPNLPLNVYLWDDNATWEFNPLKPILNDVAVKAPLKVDAVRVYD